MTTRFLLVTPLRHFIAQDIYIGFKYSIPAYALAGFTAASRIDSNKHDFLDILAGAAIGLGSSVLFTTEYQQEHLELIFNSSEGDYMLGFKYKF